MIVYHGGEMKTARCMMMIVFIAAGQPSAAQRIETIQLPFITSAPPALSPSLQLKVLSGEMLRHLANKISDSRAHGRTEENSFITVVIYSAGFPTPAFIADLEALGVRAVPASWIPPLQNHPLGFFMARVPIDRIADVLAIAEVRQMDTAEREAIPMNNLAAVDIKANLAWAKNWTGTGVKVGVIDSGFDDRMPSSELPAPIAKRDYYNYPASIDTTVRNTVSSHGTHVVGSVLGRGGWSFANTINGGGAYKGMAPNADLVFLKIGGETTSNATTAAEVAAIKAAVDTFFVNVINLSYGGWDTYHDGSDAVSQAIDYAFSKGVACFVAAGNSAAEGHHASQTVKANDTSGIIRIDVAGAGSGNTFIEMNLVWRDSTARDELTLLYYNSDQIFLSAVTKKIPTVSPRGTVSEDSYYNYYLPSGNSTYYVRVANTSSTAQPFHLYFSALFGGVVFATPDPFYTIGAPALADHACAVGAYTTRVDWKAADDSVYHFTNASGSSDIAIFSSRGPRIDGLQKPNITAPGSAIVSLRDRDVSTTASGTWSDNDGISGGPANYYVMQGTSMASPICAGAGALVRQHSPMGTPQQIYDALALNARTDAFTGAVPNATWGQGKLDVDSALGNIPLPVELASFTATSLGNVVTLYWKTASEVNNYGYEIEKKSVTHPVGVGAVTGTAIPWLKVGFAAGYGTSNTPREYSFTDRPKESAVYKYRLKQIDRDGMYTYTSEIEVIVGTAPMEFSLGQNYPNPFNPVTQFRFSIGSEQHVHVALYDVLGRIVADLVNEPLHAGRYTVAWDGSSMASGVYFYRITAGTYSAVRKLLLQK
jgi:subtilisin family serine protease